ncbi:MAG TPA: L-histidine N(alpha)-methyltransferase, partial [Alphaproteobacteria bacterium]|nr:L-histidine N(alpha)-methyltransferase [Alphaproteobacteria bacterium]
MAEDTTHKDDIELLRGVRRGLAARPKTLEPKWFYDETGSALFEEITQLSEYYPTRTELAILSQA